MAAKRPAEIEFEIKFFEGVLKNQPDYIDALIPLAEAYTVKGEHEKGLQIDLRLAKLCPADSTVRYNLACSYALVGTKSEAILALKKAIDLGYTDFKHLRKDKDLQSLHGDPDYEALLRAFP